MTSSISINDELRLLRDQIRELTDRLEALEGADVTGTHSFAAITTHVVAYPTSGGFTMYAVRPQDILGGRTEGSAATVTAQTDTVLAVLLGGTAPPEGTEVIIHSVADAFVFRLASPT